MVHSLGIPEVEKVFDFLLACLVRDPLDVYGGGHFVARNDTGVK